MYNIFFILPESLEKFNLETKGITDNKSVNNDTKNIGLNISLEDGVYKIPVTGVLVKNANPLYRLMGVEHTGYSEIISSINHANSLKEVNSIELRIDSPGGELKSLKKAMDAVKNSKKPITAIVDGIAASAAYGIASQSKEIIAANNWAEVGSVGVIAYYMSTKDLENKMGVKTLVFRGKQSPKKNLEIETKEGGEDLQRRIDEYGALFYEQIAAGRNQPIKFVEENYGEGSMFLAEESYKRRMIDGIMNTEQQSNSVLLSDFDSKKDEEKNMGEENKKILILGGKEVEDLQDKKEELVYKTNGSVNPNSQTERSVTNINNIDSDKQKDQYFHLLADYPKYKELILNGYSIGLDVRVVEINILKNELKTNKNDVFLNDPVIQQGNAEVKGENVERQHDEMLGYFQTFIKNIRE